jgi:WD40 repeat protein
VAKPKEVPLSIAKHWLSQDEMRGWDKRMVPLLKGLPRDSTPLALSADGKIVAFISTPANFQIWNLTTQKLQSRIPHGRGGSHQASTLSADGSLLAIKSQSSGRKRSYEIWDTRSGKLLHVLTSRSRNKHHIVFSPDGTKLATEDYDGLIEIWDVRSGKLSTSINAF